MDKKKKISVKRKTMWVNLSHTKYLTVRRCVKEMGWKVTDSNSKCILIWSDSEGTIDFAQKLQRWQFFNHFPGMWSIAHKVELVRLYDKMNRALPRFYDFHPKSFMLPLQMQALQSYMSGISKRSERTIIVKPDRGSQGRGIQIIQDFEDIEEYDESAVAQVYLPPLLLNNRKFDLRIYVLVTSCDPLRVYIFKEGMARFCTEDYQPPKLSNLDEAYSHLTNFSLNKHNEAFDFKENKKSLTEVLKQMDAQGVSSAKVMYGIDRIIRLTLIAAQPFLASSYHTGISSNDGKSRCFEILGFDILIDEKAQPWLLEVNCMPSLASYSEFDSDLKSRVITDTLKVIDLEPSFKQKCMQRFRTMSTHGTSTFRSIFSPNRESEIAQSTEWRQLLPVVDDPEMEKICCRALAVATGSTCSSTMSRRISLPIAIDEAKKKQPTQRSESTTRMLIKPKVIDTERKPETAKPRVVSAKEKPIERPVSSKVSRPATATAKLTSRTPRSVILANEARALRMNALDKRTKYSDNTPMFSIHDMKDRACIINENEERERIKTMKHQAQIAASLAMLQQIKTVIKDGKNATYGTTCSQRVPETMAQKRTKYQVFTASISGIVKRENVQNWNC